MKWISPVSFDSETMAQAVRTSLEELEYLFTRESDKKHYSQFLIVMPLGRNAYVFRYIVEYPAHFVVECYDTIPAHSGKMPYIEIVDFGPDAIPHMRKLLVAAAGKLPRDPWKFTRGQRFTHGYFIPEFRRARKAWKALGITADMIERKEGKELNEKKKPGNDGSDLPEDDGKERSSQTSDGPDEQAVQDQ